jgi:hypothetical protein
VTIEPRPGPGSIARGVALGVIGFVATVALLLGVASLIGQAGKAGSGSPAAAAATATATATARLGPSALPTASPTASAARSVPASPSPSPSPTPIADAVLVGAGDIADCTLDEDSKTAALVAAIPGTVFTAGDNAYDDGSAKAFKDCYGPTWGRFRDRTRPAPGNHDWETEDLAGYLGYFGEAAAPSGTSWYSYELGAWHVIVLDSDCAKVGGCGPTSPQGRWLAGDLRASEAACTLAIWHHPRFSSGIHGNIKDVAPFWRALYDGGADLVINGHDHDYERFAPQDPAGRADAVRGIREFVVGTGGAQLRPFLLPVANSQLRAAVANGVIRLDLRPGSYGWTFIPTSGSFGDSGTGACH